MGDEKIMKIVLDGFGGDFSPLEPVMGAVMAIKEKNDLEVVITGKENEINEILKDVSEDVMKNITVVDAPETVENEDEPISAVRKKKESSLVKGLKLVADNEGEAFVSAGNTGAVFTGATLIIKRIKGIKRSALAPIVPTLKGKSVVVDSGANAECKAEYYPQFALMGSVYSRCVFEKENPKVGLINIGVEHHKGTHTVAEAYGLMEKDKNINFVGNVEAREVLKGAADVYVCDGWSGNLVIKSTEGTLDVVFSLLKDIFKKNFLTKIAAGIMLPHLKEMKKKFSAKETGGALVIGLKAPVVKAHGNSDREAFKNAILFADKCAKERICEKIEELVKTQLSETEISE